jgi:hypothetical protein
MSAVGEGKSRPTDPPPKVQAARASVPTNGRIVERQLVTSALGAGATLTLHFCDEDFASGARNRTARVSLPRADIRTHVYRAAARKSQSPNGKTPNHEQPRRAVSVPSLDFGIWDFRTAVQPPPRLHRAWLNWRPRPLPRGKKRCGIVTCYRSATVTDSHGLSCCRKWKRTSGDVLSHHVLLQGRMLRAVCPPAVNGRGGHSRAMAAATMSRHTTATRNTRFRTSR